MVELAPPDLVQRVRARVGEENVGDVAAQKLVAVRTLDEVKQELLVRTKDYAALRAKHEESKLKLGKAAIKLKDFTGAAVDVEMRGVAVSAAQVPQPIEQKK